MGSWAAGCCTTRQWTRRSSPMTDSKAAAGCSCRRFFAPVTGGRCSPLSGAWVRRRSVGIAQHTVAHAPQRIGQAPLVQQFLALRHVEKFNGPVDPAGPHAQGGRRVHQVAHHQRAVLEPGGPSAVCQDHHHGGGAVEGIAARVAHDLGVHPGEVGNGLRVLDHHHHRGLGAHTGGRPGAASKMASSSSGLICSGRNFRMLRRSLSTRSVSLVIGTRFLSLSKSSP